MADEILSNRRARASELALEAARRRVREAEDRLAELQVQFADLQVQFADLEAALDRSLTARESDARQWRARIRQEERKLLAARQQAFADRAARDGAETARRLAEQELERRRADPASRELAAERRIRELEVELALVIRRASEFEYGVRVVLFEAFSVLGRLARRVSGALGPEQLATGDPGGEHGLARFDAALARLRVEHPPPEDEVDDGSELE